MAQGKLVLLIGPSGVGKSVILKTLRDKFPQLVFPRSATTRPRRPGEGDELYHFVTDVEFDAWLENGKFLEWAQVHKGARYGTLLSEILPAIDAGKVVVREVDVQGFLSIRVNSHFSGGTPQYRLQTMFILPESESQLVQHITKRSPMEKEELQRRIDSVRHELQHAPLTDVQITNHEGRLADTIAAVERAIFGE